MSPKSTSKPKALFVLSSATELPLSQPVGHAPISTGFFLVEMAQVLEEFGDEYDFVFATPDGKVPQLDINGLTLAFHAVDRLGPATLKTAIEQRGRDFNADGYRRKHPELVTRRDAELELAYRHLGRLPVSEILPNTEKEVRLIRDEVIAAFESLPEREYASIQQLAERDRDPDDPFSLGDFTFVHMPGGHAPMVDFHDNP
jgi:putative intracellular protease/amidase